MSSWDLQQATNDWNKHLYKQKEILQMQQSWKIWKKKNFKKNMTIPTINLLSK